MPDYLYFASFRSFHFFFYKIWQNNCFLLFLPSPLKVKSQTITHCYKRKGESFLFFSSHSLPLGHVSYCHHFSSVVCRPSVNISHFIQFLRNHSEKRDSTCNDFSNDWGLSSKIKDESSAYWLMRNSEFFICTPVISLSFF